MRKRNPYKVTALAAAISAGTALSIPGYALDFSAGDVEIGLDTNLSIGAGWRLSDVDYESVGPITAAAAGESESHRHGTASQDNSNLRYEKGETYSEVVKAIFDLEMTYQDYGAFTRARLFYDRRIADNGGGSDTPPYYPDKDAFDGVLTDPVEPRGQDGRSAEILDAFVWGNWYLNDSMPLNVRLGKQVVSWGEGVFFPNGINTVNPIDVNAFLAPGASIKEALIPVEALYGSLGVTENLSFEAFYQFKWEETIAPPCGTYYSTTDLVGDGCEGGFFVGGGEANSPMVIAGQQLPSYFARLPRGEDIEPEDGGQFGLAARYFIESIETEVSLYYIQYHSRLPLLSGFTPTTDSIAIPGATLQMADLSLSEVRQTLVAATGSAFGTAFLLPNAQYIVEYPEDIKLLGGSFNTTVDLGLPGGASSISGELSIRQDQPFQIEDGVLLAGLLGFPSQVCADSPLEYDCYSDHTQNEYIAGYIQEDYYQAEVSVIHFFDQILWANRWTVVLDIAGSYADIPDKSELLLNSSYNAALVTPWFPQPTWATASGLTIANLVASGQPIEEDFYPTKAAWGYKTRFSGEYNNLFAGINFVPTISFSHDVAGVSPGPLTNFLEGRKTFSLTGEFIYQNMYSVTAGYTNFFGAEPYNQLADRDNFTLSASVSF